MIRSAADDFGNTAERPDNSTEMGVQIIAPFRLNYRIVILRSENDVVMEAQVCRWHINFIYHAPAGAWNLFVQISGGLHHRLIFGDPSGLISHTAHKRFC